VGTRCGVGMRWIGKKDDLSFAGQNLFLATKMARPTRSMRKLLAFLFILHQSGSSRKVPSRKIATLPDQDPSIPKGLQYKPTFQWQTSALPQLCFHSLKRHFAIEPSRRVSKELFRKAARSVVAQTTIMLQPARSSAAPNN